MKREIKFRAWDGKEMSFWEQGKELEFYYTDNFWNDRPTKTVFMQYTGLKDKNGKEIYEGDVVNVYDEIGGEATMGQKFERFTVKVQDYAFMAFLEQMVGECEVIGNIYSDPHLLNK